MSSALAAAICRIFVGVVLLAAFIAQRRTRTSLRLQQINGYRIVPTRWQLLVLAILAATESLVGFLLLIGCWQPWAQAAATALLLLLAGAMTQALVRGLVTECGCFGSLTSSRVRPILVVRNVVLVGILVWSALTPPRLVFDAAPASVTAGAVILAWVMILAAELLRLTAHEPRGVDSRQAAASRS